VDAKGSAGVSSVFASASEQARDYASRLTAALAAADMAAIGRLGEAMLNAWGGRKQVFFCGNGGSAGNAVHLANDLLYGIAKTLGGGMKVQALPANTAVVTCLANDIGYEQIFSAQIAVLGEQGDLLIALSGSGNSPNILKALEAARERGLTTAAILGYSGGKAKAMCDIPVHFAVDDMQISEDLQLVVGHMAMQWLYANRQQVLSQPDAAQA
jgi:D-sedoheptulose 7-phosphate isomerase